MKHSDFLVRNGKVSEAGENNYVKETSDIIAWRCESCGYTDHGYETFEECPYCFYSDKTFKKITAAGITPP